MEQFVTLVNAPPVLDLSGEVAASWKLWKEQWENYAIVVQLEDKSPALQKAIFLNTIESEAFRIYKSLEVPTGQNPELLQTVLNMFDGPGMLRSTPMSSMSGMCLTLVLRNLTNH